MRDSIYKKRNNIPRGFSLIELTLVITMTMVIGFVGVAGYTQFNSSRKVENAAYDVITLLQKAKSRAQTQVKPNTGSCQTSSLDGYSVSINTSTSIYQLQALCGGTGTSVETRTLPSGITFRSGSLTSLTFLRTGGVTQTGSVYVVGSVTRTIQISSLGNMTLQ